MPEIDDTLQKLARNVKHFDVRKMLVDHRNGLTNLDNPTYLKMLKQYHASLAETNLEKLARLTPDNTAQEYFLKQVTQEFQQKLNLPFKVRFFKQKAEALKWLQE